MPPKKKAKIAAVVLFFIVCFLCDLYFTKIHIRLGYANFVETAKQGIGEQVFLWHYSSTIFLLNAPVLVTAVTW